MKKLFKFVGYFIAGSIVVITLLILLEEEKIYKPFSIIKNSKTKSEYLVKVYGGIGFDKIFIYEYQNQKPNVDKYIVLNDPVYIVSNGKETKVYYLIKHSNGLNIKNSVNGIELKGLTFVQWQSFVDTNKVLFNHNFK